jgi:hypothetical protein
MKSLVVTVEIFFGGAPGTRTRTIARRRNAGGRGKRPGGARGCARTNSSGSTSNWPTKNGSKRRPVTGRRTDMSIPRKPKEIGNFRLFATGCAGSRQKGRTWALGDAYRISFGGRISDYKFLIND